MKIIGFIVLFFIVFASHAYSESSYVLPYPSAMPGSVFYKLNLIQDELFRFWYFGDFGQFKYNLSQSDKHLVEAKTLFDYKQFLLAYNALQKSNQYFEKIYPSLLSAKKNGKNVLDKEIILKQARDKHVEELEELKENIPPSFEWKPERQDSKTLNLQDAFEKSIVLRQKAL